MRLYTAALVKGWDIVGCSWISCVASRKNMNISEWLDKGQTVMASWLGQSIWSVPSKKDNWWICIRVHGAQKLIDACGDWRLTHQIQSHRRATGAQTAEKCNAGHDIKVAELTLHHSLLYMGLRNRRPVRVSWWSPFTAESGYNGNVSVRTGP